MTSNLESMIQTMLDQVNFDPDSDDYQVGLDNLPKVNISARLDEYEAFVLEHMANKLKLSKSGMAGLLLSSAIQDSTPLMEIDQKELIKKFSEKKKRELKKNV